MEVLRTEEEQIEVIKRWLRENGVGLVVGIVLALALVLGWRFWTERLAQRQEAAAVEYETLLQAVERWQATSEQAAATTAATLADKLKSDHAESGYGELAALFAAKLAVADGKLAEAETELRWILERDPGAAIAALVRYRLARLQLAAGQHEPALKTLAAEPPAGYGFLYRRLRGDILLQQGDIEGARAAYQEAQALQGALHEPMRDPLLELKLRDLPQAEPTGQEF